MSELKIAVSRSARIVFPLIVNVNIDKVIILTLPPLFYQSMMLNMETPDEIDATGYGIPVFIATENEERTSRISATYFWCLRALRITERVYGRQLETAASHYETQLRPPFFRALVDYVNQGNSALTARVIREVSFSVAIRQAISSWNILAKCSSAPTCVMPTLQWAIY